MAQIENLGGHVPPLPPPPVPMPMNMYIHFQCKPPTWFWGPFSYFYKCIYVPFCLIYIYEKLQCNSLVWGSHTLATISQFFGYSHMKQSAKFNSHQIFRPYAHAVCKTCTLIHDKLTVIPESSSWFY